MKYRELLLASAPAVLIGVGQRNHRCSHRSCTRPRPRSKADATKLARGLEALHKAIGTDAVYAAVANGVEIEAAGAQLDWSSYPPRVSTPPEVVLSEATDLPDRLAAFRRVQTALETTRRLAVTLSDGPLLAAAVTGPHTLAHQFGRSSDNISDQDWELSGRICAELARLYCEAGANLIVVEEETVGVDGGDSDKRQAALVPLINIVKFHKKLLVSIGAADGSTQGEAFSVSGLKNSPEDWQKPKECGDLVITCAEVSPDTNIPLLSGSCSNMMASLLSP